MTKFSETIFDYLRVSAELSLKINPDTLVKVILEQSILSEMIRGQFIFGELFLNNLYELNCFI